MVIGLMLVMNKVTLKQLHLGLPITISLLRQAIWFQDSKMKREASVRNRKFPKSTLKFNRAILEVIKLTVV